MVGGQVLTGADGVDGAGEDLVRHRRLQPCFSLARSHDAGSGDDRGSWRACCLPAGVRTDSGWNWTPSAGSSRWRTAITMPLAARRTARASRAAPGRDQRVIAADRERFRQPGEQRPAVVARSQPPCRGSARPERPGRRRPRPSTGGRGRRRGSPIPASGNAPRRLDRDPRLGRGAGTGRDDQPVDAAGEQLVDRRARRCGRRRPRAELAQVLDEVVGERVVVVDDEDVQVTPTPDARPRPRSHGRSPSPSAATPGTRSRAWRRRPCRRRPGRGRGRP